MSDTKPQYLTPGTLSYEIDQDAQKGDSHIGITAERLMRERDEARGQLANAEHLLERIWHSHGADGDGCLAPDAEGCLEIDVLKYQEKYGHAWWYKPPTVEAGK